LTVSSDIPGTTFSWSNGLGTNPNVTVSPTTTTTYSVTGTTLKGCTGTAEVTVTVHPLPTITASATPTEICLGESSDLMVSSDVPGTTFSWSNGLGTNPNVTVNPTATTTYSVTGTTSEGCTGTAEVTVTVHPLPTITASATPTEICLGESSDLMVSSDIPGTTFSWSNGLGTNPNVTVSPTATTTYSVTGTSNGCSAIATITITVEQCITPITPCPSAGPVTYNGFTYNTVQIGTQCWMIENLRTTKYRDGTDITDGTSTPIWSNTTTTGKWCPNQGTGSADGLFYDFYAASSTNNICPAGWRVPTQYDFETLQSSAGGSSEGNKLKDNINWNGTNSLGWKGIYGGYRAGSGTYYDYKTSGTFCYGSWWTKTTTGSYAVDFRLYDNGGIQINTYGSDKKTGRYIRCIKD